MIELHAQGKLPLEELITTYNVKDFQMAIDDAKAGRALKAVLTWE